MSARVQGLLIAIAATLPYLGSFGYGFIEYDDQKGIVDNTLIRELSPAAIARMFEPTVRDGLVEYMPLKSVSFAVDHALFGLSAPGFRLQQQLWYVAAVVLTWLWLRRLLLRLERAGRLPGVAGSAGALAFLCGVLFAVHPVHVESVVWLSGRKDVLCGTFTALALLCALGYGGGRRGLRALVLALLACGLALLSKPMAVVLPGLFVLQDWVLHPDERRVSALLARWPLYVGSLAMSLAFALFYLGLTGGADAGLGGEDAWRFYSGPAALRWGQQLGGFLWLSLWPTALAPVYPPDLLDPAVMSVRGIGGLTLLFAFVAALLAALLRGHPLALALGLFALPLLPILATPPWAQYIAGRYLFHAVLGALLLIALGGSLLIARRPALRRTSIAVAGFACIVFMGFTFAYASVFESERALWRATARAYPSFATAHERAAKAALKARDQDAASVWLQRCLEARPGHPACTAMLGGLLWDVNAEMAEQMLREGLADDPGGQVHMALAFRLAAHGRGAEGLALYERHLSGKRPTLDQLRPLVALSLAADDGPRTRANARALVDTMASAYPSQPPPVELLKAVARRSGDAELQARIDAALARCHRVDCFARHAQL